MKRAVLSSMLGFLVLVTFAQAKDYPLTASSTVPAAKGKVSLDKDKNGNLKVKIQVEHLAKPSNLTPAQTDYIVWIQARGKDAENQGRLRVNDKLEGQMETTTPYESFDIFVTGEDHANATNPSGLEVLRGTIQP